MEPDPDPPSAAVAEGLRLVNEADRCLAGSRFAEAAQLYAKAGPLLAPADGSTGEAVAGCHYLARAVGSYFDDKTEAAVRAIVTAQGRFQGPTYVGHQRFCAALKSIFTALLAHESDDYTTACAHLSQALPLLDHVAYSFQDFAGCCAFWRDWASVQILGGQLCDQVEDIETDEAAAIQAQIGAHLAALIDRSSDESARLFFTLHGDIYAAIVAVSQAIRAFNGRAHQRALATFATVLPELRASCSRIARLELPAHVQHLNESFLFLEAMAQGFARLAEAEMCIYSGRRVAAIGLSRAAVTELQQRRTQFTPSIRGGLGYDTDIDELISDAKMYASRVCVRDPGIMAMEADVAKLVPPDLLPGTIAQMHELTNAFMGGLWVSTLALTGGLLETILLVALSKHAPPPIAGQPTQPSESQMASWNLGQILREAEQRSLLPKGLAHLSHGLREFRNLLHPGKRIRDGHDPAEADASTACKVLALVIRDLARAQGASQSHSP